VCVHRASRRPRAAIIGNAYALFAGLFYRWAVLGSNQ
jgi:hypothetical protein